MTREFHVWAAGDAHVGTDLRKGRQSLAEALRQSESGGDEGGPPFPWDIMIDVGDLSGSQTPPDDDEGREVVSQYGVLKQHRRDQIYNIVGNHDASGQDEPTQWWFHKWVDPMGQHTAYSGVDASRRPFQVQGEWDHYSFTAGNLLFLLMGDRNDGGPPVGRGAKGGYPAGAVTRRTFDWWVGQVEANPHRIIVSVHHHMLRETTCGSGPWEGFEPPDPYGRRPGRYHGYFPDGGPMGSGYLYWVDGNPDAQAFERYLAAHPGCIDLWIGGHTHTNPDDVLNGRSLCERKWGVTFLNCAAMSAFHGRLNVPQSRPMTFVDGSDQLRIRCYQHTSLHAPQGWYDKAERVVPLRHRFEHPGRAR
jgi:hypothetical protein